MRLVPIMLNAPAIRLPTSPYQPRLSSASSQALRETIIAQVDRARAKLDSSKHRLSDVRVQVEVSRAALLEELNMKK